MEIIIKCTCGNAVKIPVKDGKQAMLRDYFKSALFRLTKADNQEIQIWCGNCKSWVALRLD